MQVSDLVLEKAGVLLMAVAYLQSGIELPLQIWWYNDVDAGLELELRTGAMAQHPECLVQCFGPGHQAQKFDINGA